MTRTRTVFSGILFIGLVVVGILYGTRHKEEFQVIASVSICPVALMILVKLILTGCRGVELKMLTDQYGLNLKISQWLGLSVAGSFTNILLPFPGGAPLKAVYLKKFHSFRYASFLTATVIANVVRLTVVSLCAVVFMSLGHHQNPLLFVTAAVIFISTFGFLLFGHRISDRRFSSWSRLQALVVEWRTLRVHQPLMIRLIMLNCILILFSSLMIYISFQVFSIHIPLVSCGLIAVFSAISRVPNLVPGNLGVREAVFILISNMYGVGVNEAFHAAAFHRIVGTTVTLVLTPVFIHRLSDEGFQKSFHHSDKQPTAERKGAQASSTRP
jgi:uncharacterized membrane protein YbhN (UPF0104 family)